MADLRNVGTFVLTDSSLDSHSERIIVEGVDLTRFKANPIMLFNHLRPSRLNSRNELNLPIGIWKNIKKQNGQVVADAYIDTADDFAVKIGDKVEKGIITSASIGLAVKAVSDDEKDKIRGQKGVTITKCEIRECSLVDIPSNPNARIISKVYAEKKAGGKAIKLDDTLVFKTISKTKEAPDGYIRTEADNWGAMDILKRTGLSDKEKTEQDNQKDSSQYTVHDTILHYKKNKGLI